MKRTAGDIVCAGALQAHVTVDDIDDVGALEQFLDERLRDAAVEGQGSQLEHDPEGHWGWPVQRLARRRLENC